MKEISYLKAAYLPKLDLLRATIREINHGGSKWLPLAVTCYDK